MLRALRLLTVFAATLLMGLSFVSDASAQDTEKEARDKEHRLEIVRRMDKGQKARLKRALEEFNKLSPEKQAELRRKVKRIGDQRLLGLAGKDVKKLRRRHESMRKRHEALLQMIGPERLEGLTDVEKAYVHAMAARRFHEYFKNSMLKLVGPMDRIDWKSLSEAERRERGRAARDRFESAVLERRSEQERAAYAQTSGKARKAMMREFMESEHQRLAMDFAPVFEATYLAPFLASPPEERAKQLARFQKMRRWYEVKRLLHKELSRDHRRRLWRLRPDQLAEVRAVWDAGAELSPAERRTNVAAEIDRLYSEAAPSGDDARERRPGQRGGGYDIDDGRRKNQRKRRAPR